MLECSALMIRAERCSSCEPFHCPILIISFIVLIPWQATHGINHVTLDTRSTPCVFHIDLSSCMWRHSQHVSTQCCCHLSKQLPMSGDMSLWLQRPRIIPSGIENVIIAGYEEKQENHWTRIKILYRLMENGTHSFRWNDIFFVHRQILRMFRHSQGWSDRE